MNQKGFQMGRKARELGDEMRKREAERGREKEERGKGGRERGKDSEAQGAREKKGGHGGSSWEAGLVGTWTGLWLPVTRCALAVATLSCLYRSEPEHVTLIT
eukprot:3934924-Rhodomonas_salina.1